MHVEKVYIPLLELLSHFWSARNWNLPFRVDVWALRLAAIEGLQTGSSIIELHEEDLVRNN